MPDFDIDFCQERRDEVISYVKKKFGEDKVAHIITFGKLQARAVLRDVGRVLQIPYGQVDRICKMVPSPDTHVIWKNICLKAYDMKNICIYMFTSIYASKLNLFAKKHLFSDQHFLPDRSDFCRAVY